MDTFFGLLRQVLLAALRLALFVLAALVALAVLGLALALLLVGWLWALLRGRGLRAPPLVVRMGRFGAQTVWRQGPPWGSRRGTVVDAEVVDVQVREARDVTDDVKDAIDAPGLPATGRPPSHPHPHPRPHPDEGRGNPPRGPGA